MSLGHPYFNRDVGSQLNNNDPWMNAQSQNAQMNSLFGLGMCGGGGQQTDPYAQAQAQLNAQAALQIEQIKQAKPIPKKEKSMFKEIVSDVKGFVLEHRSVIYFIAFALLLDHFFFRGAFKARLQGMADRLVTKVEEKIQ